MQIAALRETAPETRVALTPQTARWYRQTGLEVAMQSGAGVNAGYDDAAYEAEGVLCIPDLAACLAKTRILLCVNAPSAETVLLLPEHGTILCIPSPEAGSPLLDACASRKQTLFSMQRIPRISRAQAMDALSSQSNLAGYRAVIEALQHFGRAMPMMMTAAGMIHPAKVLVLGAGVAGLQAIATAKRLGAQVRAFDVRQAAREQVESLGAEFVEVGGSDDAETASGYAREQDADARERQAQRIAEEAAAADIIITTALIPGKKAPILLTESMLFAMKPGSVVVDLAAQEGGNCEATQPDNTVQAGPVTVIGITRMERLVSTSASALYANNLMHLLRLGTLQDDTFTFDPNDEIIRAITLCHPGD